MAGSKKRIGGVRRRDTPAPPSPIIPGPAQGREAYRDSGVRLPLAPVKKIGGVKIVLTPKCRECAGRYLSGRWRHEARCSLTVVLWKHDGHRISDWTSPIYQCCPYKCEPLELPSAFTHDWRCPFWDDTEEVPFAFADRETEAPPSEENRGSQATPNEQSDLPF